MQYRRPPLGPNPSPSMTSSREMSSLTSASISTQNSKAPRNKKPEAAKEETTQHIPFTHRNRIVKVFSSRIKVHNMYCSPCSFTVLVQIRAIGRLIDKEKHAH